MSELLTPSDVTRYLDLSLAEVMKAIHRSALSAAEQTDGVLRIELEEAIRFGRETGLNVSALVRLRKKRVLVVDDDLTFAEMVMDALSTNPAIWCRHAASLFDAKAVLPEFRPHVIFLDARLPDGMGSDLLTDISSSGCKGVHVVGMSALPSRPIVDDMLGKGAACFMSKPVEPDKLLEAVENAGTV